MLRNIANAALRAVPELRILLLLEHANQFEPCGELPLQRCRGARLLQLRIGAEEFGVLAIVDDAKELLDQRPDRARRKAAGNVEALVEVRKSLGKEPSRSFCRMCFQTCLRLPHNVVAGTCADG